MASQGAMPTTQPIQNGHREPPGPSYFSWTAPKKIIAALAAKIAIRAAMSLIPVIIAMSTIITDDDREYSAHR